MTSKTVTLLLLALALVHTSRSAALGAVVATNDVAEETGEGESEPKPGESEKDDVEAQGNTCSPYVNTRRLRNAGCNTFKQVCVDQGVIVFLDPRYRPPMGEEVPKIKTPLYNWPLAATHNSDAFHAKVSPYVYQTRPLSGAEPTEELRNPTFSNCTVPLVLVPPWMYNMGEFIVAAPARLHYLQREARLLGNDTTIVLATPYGLGLAPFHSLMLQPYTSRRVVTLAELSARVQGPADWTAEGTRMRCFQKFLICNLKSTGRPFGVAAELLRLHSQELPHNPLGFPLAVTGPPGQAGGKPRALQVVLESRNGPVRNILNMEELLGACRELSKAGFRAGAFNDIESRNVSFSSPEGVPRPKFLDNMATVRSADVLVVVHGAGASNAYFLPPGAALVEMRPCVFGTHFASWPDKYLPAIFKSQRHVVQFFAYNIEHKAQCRPGDVERLAHRRNTTLRGAVNQNRAIYSRDQHLNLDPGMLFDVLHHIAAVLYDGGAYYDLVRKGTNYAYALETGVSFGKRDM